MRRDAGSQDVVDKREGRQTETECCKHRGPNDSKFSRPKTPQIRALQPRKHAGREWPASAGGRSRLTRSWRNGTNSGAQGGALMAGRGEVKSNGRRCGLQLSPTLFQLLWLSCQSLQTSPALQGLPCIHFCTPHPGAHTSS